MSNPTNARIDYAALPVKDRLALAIQLERERLKPELQLLHATCPPADKVGFEAGLEYVHRLILFMGWMVEKELNAMAEFGCIAARLIGFLEGASARDDAAAAGLAFVEQLERCAEQMTGCLCRLKALRIIADDRGRVLGLTPEDLFVIPVPSGSYGILQLMDGSPNVVKILDRIEEWTTKIHPRDADLDYARRVFAIVTSI